MTHHLKALLLFLRGCGRIVSVRSTGEVVYELGNRYHHFRASGHEPDGLERGGGPAGPLDVP